MVNGQVIFVLGVAHSGTTIVYRLLGRHPSLAWFSQFSQRSGTVPGRAYFPFWGRYNRYARNLFGVPWRKQRGFGEYVIPRPMEANTIWNYLLPAKQRSLSAEPAFWSMSDLTPGMQRRVRMVFNEELRQWKRFRIINKLPRLTRALPVLNELFDRVKFIHLVRDGRAVASSLASKFERKGHPRRTALKRAGLHWKSVVEFVDRVTGNQVKSGNFLRLRLEDFQQAPEDRLKELLGFLGLDVERYPGSVEVRKDTNTKWRRRGSRNDIRLLEKVLSESLIQLGYNTSWLK